MLSKTPIDHIHMLSQGDTWPLYGGIPPLLIFH